ncbi:MAG: AAA family ATPase [Deltaproteobacteria bacterium]|nr:AAA family ATPase [Deltaproteobacteria bacterium]
MLTSLHLKGFKSFDDERMALGGLTVLVGANASGKSNVLDAIRLLQGLALGKPVSTAIRGEWVGGLPVWPGVRGGVADIAMRGREEFELGTTWETKGGLIEHHVQIGLKPEPRRLSESIALHGQRMKMPRGLNDLESIRLGAPGKIWPSRRAGVSQVRRILSEALFLDITPSRMRDYAPKSATRLDLEGENVSALAWSVCQDAEARADLVDWLAELCAPELEDIDFAETELGDVMLILVERGGRRMPARSLSDGTLRFLGELLALRTAPEGSLMLIEEIENGLHPTRAHLLVEAMEAAVVERKVQIIATTHSPLVLNALSRRRPWRGGACGAAAGLHEHALALVGALPGFDEVVARRGIDHLFTSGWLERAV